MDINIAQLQELTREAIRQGEEERRHKLTLQLAEEAREKREEEIKATSIIAQIPGRAQTEARAGRSHAVVMSIGYDDYDRPRDWIFNGANRRCEPTQLKGAAKTVYEYCVASLLKPTIEFWHDGMGEKSGFDIVIHW